jgi:hypothetical protein
MTSSTEWGEESRASRVGRAQAGLPRKTRRSFFPMGGEEEVFLVWLVSFFIWKLSSFFILNLPEFSSGKF